MLDVKKIRLILELRESGISDSIILSAIEKIPREKFIPENFRNQAYDNLALPIGDNQTISQPFVVAKMTQLLELESKHKVLEIGTGSGYQSAVLSKLVRRVYTIERIKNLSIKAENIFKELNSDLKINIPCSGNLTSWALEGVLLLNSSLTVESNNPNSHQNIGWKFFTDKVIEVLGNKKDMVYILWGKNAQLKKSLINTQENLVIESAHPSPFSADKGFFGSKPFSKTNDYLIDKGKRPINWKLV